MVKWKFKSCPRCLMGDVFITRDIDGWYEQCLMCSHRCDLKNIDELKNHTVSVGETRVNSEKL